MGHALRGLAIAAAALVVTTGTGCVSMIEHNKALDKLKEQEKYIQSHKDEVKEFERREQTLTMQSQEREKQQELLRTRLEKSELLRKELEKNKLSSSVVTTGAEPTPAPILGGGFRINPASGGIVLEHDILFTPGHAELKPSGRKALDEITAKLNGGDLARYAVRVDGHPDGDPVLKSKGTNTDNWGLSAQRALVVLRYMEAHGISSDRLFIAGFGSQRPLSGLPPVSMPVSETRIATKHVVKGKHGTTKIEKHGTTTAKASDDPSKAQNRRVEIVLFERK